MVSTTKSPVLATAESGHRTLLGRRSGVEWVRPSHRMDAACGACASFVKPPFVRLERYLRQTLRLPSTLVMP
jgi:hypothetical protein